MTDLFDSTLFSAPVNVLGTQYSIASQVYVFTENWSYCLAIGKTGQGKDNPNCGNTIILSVDNATKKLLPIERNKIVEIIGVLKQLPLMPELEKLFKSIPSDLRFPGKGMQVRKLFDKTFALVSDVSPNFEDKAVQIVFNGIMPVRPLSLCVFSTNSIDYNICFSIAREFMTELTEWHFLTGLKCSIGGKVCPIEFMPYSISSFQNVIMIGASVYEFSILHSKKFKSLKSLGIGPLETADFMLSLAGFYGRVSFPKESRERFDWYTVIVPIDLLRIPKEIDIGNVRFVDESNQYVQEMSHFSGSSFHQYSVFAYVHVNEHTPFAAYRKAYAQIERSVDVLACIIRNDLLFATRPFGEKIYNKTQVDLDLSFSIVPIVYITSALSSTKFFYDDSQIAEHASLAVSNSLYEAFQNITHIENLLIVSSEGDRKDIEPVLNALRWARKAWEAKDSEDAVIYACTSLEFLVAKEAKRGLIDKKERKEIKKDLETSVRRIFDIGDSECTYVNRVLEKFDYAYSDMPFMNKLRNLVTRLRIPVSETELDLLHSIRKKRNLIVHGEGRGEVSQLEIRRLCETITTIALYEMRATKV